MEDLKATPLRADHENLKALMAPFGGWLMPIQYAGIIAEHRWCREKAALFDICHMGEFLFKGDLVADGLENVFTFSVKSIPVGRSRYGFLLNDAGGVIDDLIVFHAGTARKDGRIVTNGGRVLGVTARGDSVKAAIAKAYAGVRAIHWPGAQYRTDIGKKAL